MSKCREGCWFQVSQIACFVRQSKSQQVSRLDTWAFVELKTANVCCLIEQPAVKDWSVPPATADLYLSPLQHLSLQEILIWTLRTERMTQCPAWPQQQWACPSSCSPPPPAWSSSPGCTPVNQTGKKKIISCCFLRRTAYTQGAQGHIERQLNSSEKQKLWFRYSHI